MTHSHHPPRARDQYSRYYRPAGATDANQDFAPRRQQAQTTARPSPARPSPTTAGGPPTAARLPQAHRPYPYPPNPTGHRSPSRTARAERRSPRNFLLAGGSMLALAALVVGPKPIVDRAEQVESKVVCQETVQAQSVLSRAELSELLAIEERAPKGDVRAVIAEPYCTLPAMEVREGVTAQREAYPLEFNPETWFIVLYEGEEYAGFDFSFSRE